MTTTQLWAGARAFWSLPAHAGRPPATDASRWRGLTGKSTTCPGASPRKADMSTCCFSG
jgi:hypothetical protein